MSARQLFEGCPATRLLQNPCLQIPAARRDELIRMRDELAGPTHPSGPCVNSPAVAKQNTARETHVESPGEAPVPTTESVAALALPSCDSTAVDEAHLAILGQLERRYRAMPKEVPAKHAVAIRLAELFRRSGLGDKSRSYRGEAQALKAALEFRRDRHDVPGRGQARSVPDCPPKVTVITACRNAERYLGECLDSILDQTMPEWELFLLDDGSTDETPRIIRGYADRDARIKARCFNDSTGPYVRRNFAIERAGADFIVVHDSEDIMYPTKLETLYRAISADDQLAMVGSGYRTFLERWQGPEYSEYNQLPLTHEEIIARFKSWLHAMSHGSAIIRKTLFQEIGRYDENPFAADSFWSAKLATYIEAGQPFRTKNLADCLTLVRMHATNHARTLSTLDPRNRRARYRQYCECRLRRLRDRLQAVPGLGIGRELRECRCGDFLTRFKAQIIAWEGAPLEGCVIPEYLQRALSLFNDGYYISCVNVLNGVESFEPAVTRRVVGYDLIRAMALYAVRLKEHSQACLGREIQRHDNPAARQFAEDAFASSQPVDVGLWYRENAERYNLGLVWSDNETVSERAPHAVAAAKL